MAARSLAQLWRHGTAADKEFVRKLLLSYSGGKDVTAAVWRLAETDWIKALRLHSGYGQADPELAAMIYLAIVTAIDGSV